MKHYFIWWTCFSFLHVFKENLAEVPNIIVEDQCVQYSGTATITCTFSSITIGNILLINWYGPGGNSDRLVFSGTDIKPAKYNGQNTATTLSLTIKNVDASDIGNYTCEYSGDTGQITFSQTHIEDIKCVNSVGGTEQITIHIESNNVAGVWQEAVVTNDAGDTIRANCSYDPVGQFSEGTCKFTGIAAGKYNYMVYSHGNCELNCTNAADITVDGPPTTVNTAETAGPTTVSPTSAAPPTTAPTSAVITSVPPTTDDTITTPEPSNNSLTIVYGVCGALGGLVIIFAFSAFLIYKNKRMRSTTSRSKEYKEPKPNRRNIPPDYDNPAFSGVQQSRVYKSDMGQPNNGQVSAHSSYLYPGHQKPERNVHVRPEIHGNNFSSHSNGRNYRERPLDVKYYKGPGRRC